MQARKDERKNGVEADAQGQRRRKLGNQARLKHQLHGSWPNSTSPEILTTNDSSTYRMYGEDLALREAIEGIQRIRTWAEAASKSPEAKERTLSLRPISGKTRRRETPLRTPTTVLVGYLAEIYPEYFDRKFGIHKNSIEDGYTRAGVILENQSVNYIQACLRPLGIDMTCDAIEKAWDNYRKDNQKVSNAVP